MSKIPNINCNYYTSFGQCLHPELAVFPSTKPTCILLNTIETTSCEFQTGITRPKPSPNPPTPGPISKSDIDSKWETDARLTALEDKVDKILEYQRNILTAVKWLDDTPPDGAPPR